MEVANTPHSPGPGLLSALQTSALSVFIPPRLGLLPPLLPALTEMEFLESWLCVKSNLLLSKHIKGLTTIHNSSSRGSDPLSWCPQHGHHTQHVLTQTHKYAQVKN